MMDDDVRPCGGATWRARAELGTHEMADRALQPLLPPELLQPLLDLEARADESQLHDFCAATLLSADGSSTAASASSPALEASEPERAAARAAFRGAAERGLKPDELEASLRRCGLGASAAAAAHSWATLGRGVHRALLASAVPIERLVDFEWCFGVTASSSELESIGATYVQLRLLLAADATASAPARRRYAHVELSLKQFYDLLLDLERARAQLDVV